MSTLDGLFSHQPAATPTAPATTEQPDAAAVPAESTGETPPTSDGLLLRGTFAIYDDGAGGLVLVAQPEGQPVVHKRIPAAMVKMGQKALGTLFGG